MGVDFCADVLEGVLVVMLDLFWYRGVGGKSCGGVGTYVWEVRE